MNPSVPQFVGAVATLIIATPIDIATRRIPNRLLLVSLVAGVLVRLIAGQDAMTDGVLWGCAGLLAGFGAWRIGAWGAGDGKLVGVLGLWLGPWGLVASLLSFPFAMVWIVTLSVVEHDVAGLVHRTVQMLHRLIADPFGHTRGDADDDSGAGSTGSRLPFVGFFLFGVTAVVVCLAIGAL